MRVLLYSRAFAPLIGGMERFAESLADWLCSSGHDVVLWTETSAPRSADRHRDYRVLRSPSTAARLSALRWADIVHVSGLSLRGITPVLALGQRPIVTHHGHQAICPNGLAWTCHAACEAGPAPGPCKACPLKGFKGKVSVLMHRLGAHMAARNVFVSEYLRSRLGLWAGDVIYNPIPLLRELPNLSGTGDNEVVAFAGRLVKEKGLNLLIQAMVLLPEVKVRVAGSGPMEPAWRALASRLSVAKRIHFLGSLTQQALVDLYGQAAVVCVPSSCDEPFGYSAAEPMALGKAVVATPRGALPEILSSQRGFVASSATPEALAESISRAAHDSRARTHRGQCARTFAQQKFGVDAIGTKYIQVYQESTRANRTHHGA
jgi:glycosyltransferase involved in cell wall biosynthesis